MKREFPSIRDEPALGGGPFPTDPAEQSVDNRIDDREEIDELRDSVANEPWSTGPTATPAFAEWLVRKRHQVSRSGNLGYTLLAALVGGPFAVAGAFMAGQRGVVQVLYIVLIGPITEELLKQSGMIYLLERKPYRLFSPWQFVLAGAVSAFIFATIENLIYIHIYAATAQLANPEVFAQFRWTVCTALHVSCSIIASLGLIRVWRRVNQRGEPADLAFAYPPFAVAMTVHGVYNLAALCLSNIF